MKRSKKPNTNTCYTTSKKKNGCRVTPILILYLIRFHPLGNPSPAVVEHSA